MTSLNGLKAFVSLSSQPNMNQVVHNYCKDSTDEESSRQHLYRHKFNWDHVPSTNALLLPFEFLRLFDVVITHVVLPLINFL